MSKKKSKFNSDIKVKSYYGCVLSLNNDDNRLEKYQKQRKERGFDDSELWSLDNTIAKFIAPRLKAFANNKISHPSTFDEEEWQKILGKMVYAFDQLSVDEGYLDAQDNPEVKEGLKLFFKYFHNLWD